MSIYRKVAGEGEDVVLLPGWWCDHRHMKPITDKLSAKYRVTAVDLPGSGKSDWQDDIATIHDMADKLLEILPEKAIYLGWSFGGFIAMSLAARFPDNVKRIVGIGTTPRFVEDAVWHGLPESGFTAGFKDTSGTKHMPFWTHPKEFNRILGKIL